MPSLYEKVLNQSNVIRYNKFYIYHQKNHHVLFDTKKTNNVQDVYWRSITKKIHVSCFAKGARHNKYGWIGYFVRKCKTISLKRKKVLKNPKRQNVANSYIDGALGIDVGNHSPDGDKNYDCFKTRNNDELETIMDGSMNDNYADR